MASGNDLPHPDKDAERERNIRQSAETASEEDTDEDSTPKVKMTISDAGGEVIRTRKFKVQQGLNRIVWDMKRDGVRPMPGPVPAELEDGLPSGLEIPAGQYEVTLSLTSRDGESATSSSIITVLPDARSQVSSQERMDNYQALLEISGMQETAVTAVERIVHAQTDISTVQTLIKHRQKPGTEESENLKVLGEQAEEIQKGLVELEKRFRTPPGTRGIVYDDNQVSNQIETAKNYVGSTADVPSAAAKIYVDLARQALDDAVKAVDIYMAGELDTFRQSLSDAGIGLFTGAIQP